MTSSSDSENNPIRCRWASRKHMEWLGNAHLAAGAFHIEADSGPHPALIVFADKLSATLQGDGPWATEQEMRRVARDQACDLATFLWDNDGKESHRAERALRFLGYNHLANQITGRWLMAQPGSSSWGEAYRQARQDVEDAFPGISVDVEQG